MAQIKINKMWLLRFLYTILLQNMILFSNTNTKIETASLLYK